MSESKSCSVCGLNKSFSEFYKCSLTLDGLHGKCKLCFCEQVAACRRNNVDHYRDYDAKREKTLKRKKQQLSYKRQRKISHSEKYKAVIMVNNAIAGGRLHRGSCEVCGVPGAQAHHDNYHKPLDVRWLCRSHHLEHHRRTG